MSVFLYILVLPLGCLIVAMIRQQRWVEERLRSCRRGQDDLDKKVVDLSQRILAQEGRLDFFEAPQTAEELAALRRLLEALVTGIQKLADQSSEDTWWKQGDPPPF